MRVTPSSGAPPVGSEGVTNACGSCLGVSCQRSTYGGHHGGGGGGGGGDTLTDYCDVVLYTSHELLLHK